MSAANLLDPYATIVSRQTRWELISAECKLPIDEIFEIMIEISDIGIIEAIENYINALETPDELAIYLGFTARANTQDRFKEHYRTHGSLFKPAVLASYESREDGCLAESLGIYYLKKISWKFMKVLNVGAGYEPETLRALKDNDNAIKIYIYCTKAPYQGPSHLTGQLKISTVQKEPEDTSNQIFCVHCQKWMKDSSYSGVHNNNHGRINARCSYCKATFVSENTKNYHEKKNHELVFRCFKSGCNFTGTLSEFHEKHYPVLTYLNINLLPKTNHILPFLFPPSTAMLRTPL